VTGIGIARAALLVAALLVRDGAPETILRAKTIAATATVTTTVIDATPATVRAARILGKEFLDANGRQVLANTNVVLVTATVTSRRSGRSAARTGPMMMSESVRPTLPTAGPEYLANSSTALDSPAAHDDLDVAE
jgi:hypothetical protein